MGFWRNFYGVEESSCWIFSIEKYFRVNNIVEDEEKMKVAAMAMRGCALKWWLWRIQPHPSMSWNTFTEIFFWHFKPKWRHFFMDLDEQIEEEEEEELDLVIETEPHTHHTTEQLLTSHPLFTQHQTVNDSTYMGSYYQEATPQIHYPEISLVKKKSCQLSKLRFSSLLSVKTNKNKRGKRRTITRKEKRASEPKTLRFSTTLPTISSEPQMLDSKTEPPDNNDLTVDDYNEAHIVPTSDFQPIRSLPIFNPKFGSSFAKTWNSDSNLDHQRNLDQETESIVVTTPQLKRKGEAVGFEADLGVRMTPGSTEPTNGSYLTSVCKYFSSLTPILSREDHPPLSESQVVGVVASSQANYMRVVVQSVPEESSGGVELLCIVRALLKKIKRRVTVGDKVLVGFVDWVDRRGMIENVFLMFLRSNGAVVFAYETCALDLLEATYERKVFPGEVVVIDGNGIQSLCLMSHPQPKQCIFEHIYFALPNSVVFGMSVYETCRRFGKVLNTESPVDWDVVIAVPDSSVVAELGNARKIPLHFPVIMRKKLKETMRALVRSIIMVTIPSVYFKSIIKLLHHSDKNIGKKALGLLCDAARNHEKLSVALKDNKGSRSRSSFPWFHMDESSQESLDKMCLEILQVLDESSNTSLKVAAVSALEVLTERFPSNSSIFGVCLGSITKCITSHNLAVNSRCLRTSAALINVLGPKALAETSAIVLSFSVDTLITFHSSNNISMPQAQPSQHALPWYCHWTLLPQHLVVHPYSQPTLPFGYFTDNGAATPAGLVAASLSHAFALFVDVSVGANISGEHVNPAVTFGAFVGGHITLVRGLLYWFAQLLGSVVACLLLKIATGGLETSAFSLSSIGESGSNF